MDERRVEELLRQRAEARAGGLAGPDFQRRARAALEDERRRGRRLRWLRGGAVLAAAAVLLVFLASRFWAPPPHAGLPLEVALLDAGGRELTAGPGLRGEQDELPRPDEVRLELLASADGYARVFLFDARGRLRRGDPPGEVALVKGDALLVSFDLRSSWSEAGGRPELTWLAVSAGTRFSEEELELPDRLDAAAGSARSDELERLRERIRARTGCSVLLHTYAGERTP